VYSAVHVSKCTWQFDKIFVVNGGRCWRPAGSDALVEIQSRLPEIKIGDCDKPICLLLRRVLI
jgi:hypothetical protein